jgi:uncharacterized protein (TIGR03435 family)
MAARCQLLLAASLSIAHAQTPRPAFDSFEVASIKPAAPEPGRFIKMQSAHRFFVKNYTLITLIGAAYNLPPTAISGGPPWADSASFDILAGTPGELRPNLDEQMAMLRKLLADRFQLTFHREEKQLPVYQLTVAKGGPKLKYTSAPPEALPELVNVVYPDHIGLPARHATIAQFASMLQRAVLDRPVLDNTGLSGAYDFDLEWAPDESQFGGQLRTTAGTGDSSKPDLYAALREQLGLTLRASKGPVSAIVIDRAERPSAN